MSAVPSLQPISAGRPAERMEAAVASLQRAAMAVAQPGGPDLFARLVEELAASLGVAVAFVAVFEGESRERMRTLAARLDGRLLQNFGYELAGSPCERVVGGSFRHVGRGVAAEFPPGTLFAAKGMDSYAAYPLYDSAGTPLGLLATMDREPIADPALAEALLKIFAVRIGAEIERSAAEEALRTAALAVSSAQGASVFDDLVCYLATLLHADVAFIALLDGEPEPQLSTIALRLDGRSMPVWRYALAGTACETVLAGGFQAYPDHVPERFPGDGEAAALGLQSYAGHPLADHAGRVFGLIAVAGRRPMASLERIEPMLRIFAVRAGAELERQRAEKALALREEQYRAIFEAASDAFILRDARLRVVDVNPAFMGMSGFTREHLASPTGYPPSFPPEHVAERLEMVRRALAGETVHAEMTLLRADGNGFDADVRVMPVRYRGEPHVLSIVRDISEHKTAERALALREEQYRAIFNGSADALVLWSRELRIVDVNPAFTQLYGYARDEVVGQGFQTNLPPEQVARRVALIQRALRGEEGLQLETTALRKTGGPFEAELRYVPIAYRGEPHVLAVIRDITERRQREQQRSELEAQLRQAQKMEAIGQLTGGIAHDFNNILTSVIGYVVLASERAEALGDAHLVRQLGQAHIAAQRARDLIAQMLAFARRQRGERHVLALAPLVRQAAQLLRSTLPASIELDNLEMETDADPEEAAPPVEADAVQLEQVLFNLCINARDAIHGSGRIGVRLRESAGGAWHCASCRARVDAGRWVQLSVQDSGSGIAPDVLERMFDPFFSTKPVGQGSGMGLAMAHGIVHDHGGHIRVDTCEGGGSTFHVMLPIAAGAVAAATARPPAGSGRSTSAPLRGRVLLVEDQPLVGDFMAELLESWGLEVVLQRDPLAAERWLAEAAEPPDLMITDQTMPQITGLALAQRAARLRPGLPVLLYTGGADKFGAEELQACGVQAVLRKPVVPEALRALARRLLEAKA